MVERFQGETVWEGEVLIFALQGHPEATTCYAWEDAVRASIMPDEDEVPEAG